MMRGSASILLRHALFQRGCKPVMTTICTVAPHKMNTKSFHSRIVYSGVKVPSMMQARLRGTSLTHARGIGSIIRRSYTTDSPTHQPDPEAAMQTVDEILDNPQYRECLMQLLIQEEGTPLANAVHFDLIKRGWLEIRGINVVIKTPRHRSFIVSKLRLPSLLPPSYKLPMTEGLFDVPTLVKWILLCFNAQEMRETLKMAYKQNKASKHPKIVPQEKAYGFRVIAILRDYLSHHGYKVEGEANVEEPSLEDTHNTKRETTKTQTARRRLDCLVITPKQQKIILEFLAHEKRKGSRGSVEDHIRRMLGDANIANATEGWVINFTTIEPDNENSYLWAEDLHDYEHLKVPGFRVVVIHVWHDLCWKNAKITWKDPVAGIKTISFVLQGGDV